MFGKVSNLLLLFLFNITKIKKVDFWHKHKQRGFIHMSFLNNLPFRTKIFCSFFCLIILTIILATTSSLSISSARARAIEKIESLNVRYEEPGVLLILSMKWISCQKLWFQTKATLMNLSADLLLLWKRCSPVQMPCRWKDSLKK